MKYPADPFAQLMQEHTTALLQLKQLHKTARAIRLDGYSTKHSRRFHSALRYIEEEVRIHNHREENALFPVLERYVDGPTRLLRGDHKKLDRWFIALCKAVEEVERRRDSFSAIRKLSDVALNGVQLCVNHIYKENYILFPLVRRFLSKEELREIARKML